MEVALNRFSSLSLEGEVLDLEDLILVDLGGKEALIWSMMPQ